MGGSGFFLWSSAIASNSGRFREKLCQTPKHDRILMFTDWTLLKDRGTIKGLVKEENSGYFDCMEKLYERVKSETMIVIHLLISVSKYRKGEHVCSAQHSQSELTVLRLTGLICLITETSQRRTSIQTAWQDWIPIYPYSRLSFHRWSHAGIQSIARPQTPHLLDLRVPFDLTPPSSPSWRVQKLSGY